MCGDKFEIKTTRHNKECTVMWQFMFKFMPTHWQMQYFHMPMSRISSCSRIVRFIFSMLSVCLSRWKRNCRAFLFA